MVPCMQGMISTPKIRLLVYIHTAVFAAYSMLPYTNEIVFVIKDAIFHSYNYIIFKNYFYFLYLVEFADY